MEGEGGGMNSGGQYSTNDKGSGKMRSLKMTRVYLKETLKEIRARKTNFCLGACACFLVVFCIALLLTILNYAPILFMRLSELSRGEIDVQLREQDVRLNYTLAMSQAKLQGAQYSLGSPRIFLDGDAISLALDDCDANVIASNPDEWPYSGGGGDESGSSSNPPSNQTDSCASASDSRACFKKYCSNGANPPVTYLFAIDQVQEAAIGVGREWYVRGAPKFNATTSNIPVGTCYLSSKLAGQLGARAESHIVVSFTLQSLLGPALWSQVRAGLRSVRNGPGVQPPAVIPPDVYVSTHTTVFVVLRVVGVYPDGAGKHDSSLEALIVDASTWLDFVANSTNPRLNPTIVARLRALDWRHYATDLVWQLPGNRLDFYRNSDVPSVRNGVTGFASALLYIIGWYNVPSSLPVFAGVNSYRFFALFFGLLLNLIILFVFLLSTLLIYSLLMVSVESRTFELGILRMVGLTRPRVVALVLCQALAYAVPAIVLGLPVAQLAAWGLITFLNRLALVELSVLLSPLSICLAIFFGLLLPVVASVLPIRAALGKNIWDSVDTRHSKTTAVEIKLTRTDDARPSVTLIVSGLAMFALGFLIYYVLPLALVTGNGYLLLNLFFLILLAMLAGLVVLALNLQAWLEWGITWLVFWWEHASVRTVTLRNFEAHRRRNAKTALMFAVSLAFIIFLSVTFTTQLDTLIVREQQQRGSTLSAEVHRSNFIPAQAPGRGLPVRELEAFVANYSRYITNHAFITMPLEWHVQSLTEARVESLGHLYSTYQEVRGVSPSLFRTSFSGYTIISSLDPLASSTNPPEALPERLYGRAGSPAAMMGASLAPLLGLDRSGPGSDFSLRLTVQELSPLTVLSLPGATGSGAPSSRTSSVYRKRLQVESFGNLAPLLEWSQYPSGDSLDTILSLPSFTRLCRSAPNSTINSVDDLLMEFVLFETGSNVSDTIYDRMKRDLAVALVAGGVQDIYRIRDTRDTTDSLSVARTLIAFFFVFTVVIAMAICFFSLISSMYTNIHEQKKEIGVMLAVGMVKGRLFRMYIWEAVVIVLASSLLGIFIGVIVAYTVTLQQTLFTQLPVPFEFPWQITVAVVILSGIFGLCAAAFPMRSVLKMSPVEILRTA